MFRSSTSPSCCNAPSPHPTDRHTEPVSFLFGGSGRDPRDQELAAANRRRERKFARDIGDERALARGDEPRYRRPGLWLLAFIGVVLVVGGYRAFQGGGTVPITKSCTTPALAIGVSSVGTGSDLEWSATGPADGHYLLVLDGTPDRAGTVSGGAAASSGFVMSGCVTHSTYKVKATTGSHQVRLFRRTEGDYSLVATKPLTVT